MAGNKRIVFVANTLWSIYHFRFYIVESLASDGYEIFVLAPASALQAHFENRPGLKFIPLQSMHPKSMSPIHDFQLYRELKKKYKSINPGLIIHYSVKPNIYGCMAAGATGHKAIAVITGKGYTLVKKGLLQSFVKMLYRKAFRSVREVWFLNEGDKLWFINKKMILPDKTFILPGEGIDTGYFKPEERSGTDKEKIVFLMIARVLKSKGVREYASAAEMILKKRNDVEFRLMGRYEENIPDAVGKNIFESWVEKKVIYYHPYTEDVKSFLAEADCIVLPSYSEGLSISLMEAASMGKPLIASNINGCKELVIDGETGFLCTPCDPVNLAEKMELFLLLSDEARNIMGRKGRRLVVENYDRSIIKSIYKKKVAEL